MPDINGPANLTSYLEQRDTRLRKLERQLAVTRTAYSSVATKETTNSMSPVPLTTADSVTINTSTRTLVNFYVRLTLESNNIANTNTVYIRDETASVNYQIFQTPGTGPYTLVTAPASSTGQIVSSGIPLGGYVNLYVTTAGSSTFSLRYAVSAGTGSFSNRLLLATAQTF